MAFLGDLAKLVISPGYDFREGHRIVGQHGLRRIPYDQIVSWGYGDFVFGAGFDIISSMTKARRYEFHEVVDTEEMFFRMFDELRASKVIP